jgi:hypothetical protein
MSDSHKSKSKRAAGATPLSDHPILLDAIGNFLRAASPLESSKRLDEAVAALSDARSPADVLDAALRHARFALGFTDAWRFAFFLAEAPAAAEALGEPRFGGELDLNKARAAIATELDLGVGALLAEGFGDDDDDDEEEEEEEEEEHGGHSGHGHHSHGSKK